MIINEDILNNSGGDEEDINLSEENHAKDSITKVTGMYKDWFLDYASYVILERAVPAIEDGFKPVQRRIMQSLKDLDDAKSKMLDGITLWMAPEGTRSKDGKLAKFKRGAFHIAIDTKALILPIAVKDIHKVQAGDDLSLYLNQELLFYSLYV